MVKIKSVSHLFEETLGYEESEVLVGLEAEKYNNKIKK